MIIYDDVFNWLGTVHEAMNPDDWDNSCRIQIIKLGGEGGLSFLKKYYIVATDHGADPNSSITTGAEVLIPLVCATHNIGLEEMVWFEYYPNTDSVKKPTLDVVTVSPIKSCCPSACSQRVSVKWRPARVNEIEHLKKFIDLDL